MSSPRLVISPQTLAARLVLTHYYLARDCESPSQAWSILEAAKEYIDEYCPDYIPVPPFIGCTVRGKPVRQDLQDRIDSLLAYSEGR